MDVSAPKSPAMPPNPFARVSVATPKPMPASSAALPVRAAPISVSTPSPFATPTAPRTIDAARPSAKKSPQPAVPTQHAPVALITVTVFVMLVLSALTIAVYMTSQTA